MGTNNALDGKETLVVVNYYHLQEIENATYYAKRYAGAPREFENNTAYVFTPNEFKAFSERTSLGEFKRQKSRTKNISWVWVKEMVILPEKVTRHFAPEDKEKVGGSVRFTRDSKSYCGHGDDSKDELKTTKQFVHIVERTLLGALKRDICFHVPHGMCPRYKGDGEFFVHVWSAPGGLDYKTIDMPTNIFGIKTKRIDQSIVIDPKEVVAEYGDDFKFIQIVDNNYVVATLFPNALYISHDATHFGSEAELEIFAIIMQKAAYLISNPESWEEYLKEIRLARLEAEKKAFEELLTESIGRRSSRNKAALETARDKARRLGEEYFAAEREVFALEQAQYDPKAAKEKFLAEFQKLQSGKVTGVLGVNFDPTNTNKLVICFGDVVIKHPLKKGVGHHIGKCNAIVSLREGSIAIQNITYGMQDGGFHTPHVFEKDGRHVCLGNISSEMRQYLSHFELEAAATLIYAFLQSVVDDYRYVERLEAFPKVDLL